MQQDELVTRHDGRSVLSQRGMLRALRGNNENVAGPEKGDLERYIARLPNDSKTLTLDPKIEFTLPDGKHAIGRTPWACNKMILSHDTTGRKQGAKDPGCRTGSGARVMARRRCSTRSSLPFPTSGRVWSTDLNVPSSVLSRNALASGATVMSSSVSFPMKERTNGSNSLHLRPRPWGSSNAQNSSDIFKTLMREYPAVVHSKEQALRFARKSFAQCVLVEKFFTQKLRTLVDLRASRTDGVVYMAFLRTQAWLATLGRLDDPQHYQAAAAGARTLFEIAVDLGLLLHCPQRFSTPMVLAWEDSCKLKYAERIKAFYETNKVEVPAGSELVVGFPERSGERVKAQRSQYWVGKGGGAIEPDRWTNRNLYEDAKDAGVRGASQLREFYLHRYPQLCWATHGSGMIGVRNAPEDLFPGFLASYLDDCREMALLIGRLSLELLNLWDSNVAGMFEELGRAIEDGEVVRAASLGAAPTKG